MLFPRFCRQLQEMLKAELPLAADVELSGSDERCRVTIRTPADILYPSVALYPFYSAFLQGLPVSEIAGRILAAYTAETLHPFSTAADHTNRNKFLKGLGLRPASLSLHRDLLPVLPHAVCDQMLFFFTVMLPDSGNHRDVSIVTKEISSHFRLTDDALLTAAAAASAERSPAVICPLSFYLDRLARDLPGSGSRASGLAAPFPESSFFVLTNTDSFFGAAVILYPGITENLYQRFGPYFLLPSSVHELLILPEKDAGSRSELKQLIRTANRNLGDSLLVLSDELYYYDPGKGLYIC